LNRIDGQAVWTTFCFLAVASVGAAVVVGDSPPRRAKPPQWTADVLDIFFEDARKELVGDRPEPASETVAAAEGSHGATAPAVDEGETLVWSRLVSSDTLESEVKRLIGQLREPLASAAKFKAGGYEDCRMHFSLLAVLFAVIEEYDAEVRWKGDAGVVRSSLARAAMNCKTATDQTFSEAAQRRTELEDLMRGERLSGKPVGLEQWSDLAERPLLMERMETLLQEEIEPTLGNAKAFPKGADAVRQKAELLSVLAEVMQREGYEYWDDAEFQELSAELRNATEELSRAAADVNYNAVRAAAGRTGQACSQCHEGYRG
jgi:hypothetical protein